MKYFLLMVLAINLAIGLKGYRILRQRKKLYSDRYAVVISMSTSFTLAFSTSLLIAFLVPFSLEWVIVVSTILGIGIGIAFGAFVKIHSVLSGYFHGAVGGMMGAMLAGVVKDPTLCGLPADADSGLLVNTITMNLFGTSLLILTFWFILYSLKV